MHKKTMKSKKDLLSQNHLRKLGAIFMVIFFIFTTAPISSSYANQSVEEQWNKIYQQQLDAKQTRVNEMIQHSNMIQRQVEEERIHMRDSQDRIWREFSDGLEMERKNIQNTLTTLDERQKAFERELERKRMQDELATKEKEKELQRLMLESERLRNEITLDQQQWQQRIQELRRQEIYNRSIEAQQEMGREADAQFNKTRPAPGGTTVTLENNTVKIAGVNVRGEEYANSGGLNQEYYVEIDDILEIDVWRVADLSKTVKVRPDGRISMPLVGDLDVLGLNLTQIKDIITDRISEYVIEPQVSIAIQQFGGRKFVILGEVKAPGVYRYEQNINLVESIALAGGFTDTAKAGQVMIIRGDIKKQPKVRIIKANALNIFKKGMLTENLTIMRNDIIYVGKDFLGDYNDVINQVISPSISSAIDFFVLRDAVPHSPSRTR